jgi:hypothetical protein
MTADSETPVTRREQEAVVSVSEMVEPVALAAPEESAEESAEESVRGAAMQQPE